MLIFGPHCLWPVIANANTLCEVARKIEGCEVKYWFCVNGSMLFSSKCSSNVQRKGNGRGECSYKTSINCPGIDCPELRLCYGDCHRWERGATAAELHASAGERRLQHDATQAGNWTRREHRLLLQLWSLQLTVVTAHSTDQPDITAFSVCSKRRGICRPETTPMWLRWRTEVAP